MFIRTLFLMAMLAVPGWAVQITDGYLHTHDYGRQGVLSLVSLTFSNGFGIYYESHMETLIGTPYCTGTCTFDPTVHITGNGWPSNAPYRYTRSTFDLQFSGPQISAVAVYDPDSNVYTTSWGPVPFSVSGTVTYTDELDSSNILSVSVYGSGLVRADSSAGYFLSTGFRVDYDIVPEPSTGKFLATGMLLMLAIHQMRPLRRRTPQ